MNKKQEEFLREFHKLCKKYSIDRVAVRRDNIVFESNGQTLEIAFYCEGNFVDLAMTMNGYTIEEEK